MEDYIVKTQRQHKENPNDFFKEILQNIWCDRSEERIILEWKRLCTQVRWYAKDVLECIETILDNPPPKLVELMQEEGWIILNDKTQNQAGCFNTKELYLDWLRQTSIAFSQIYEENK